MGGSVMSNGPSRLAIHATMESYNLVDVMHNMSSCNGSYMFYSMAAGFLQGRGRGMVTKIYPRMLSLSAFAMTASPPPTQFNYHGASKCMAKLVYGHVTRIPMGYNTLIV